MTNNQAEPAENTTKLAEKCLNRLKYTCIGRNTTKNGRKGRTNSASTGQNSIGNRPKQRQKPTNLVETRRITHNTGQQLNGKYQGFELGPDLTRPKDKIGMRYSV